MAARNAYGVEDASRRFDEWCNGEPTCPLRGTNISEVLDDVSRVRPEVRPLVGNLLPEGHHEHLGWPALAQVLALSATGDMSALDQLLSVASDIDPNAA